MAEFFDKKLQEREIIIKEKSEDRLLSEANIKKYEAEIKSRELDIKERELEIRSKELRFARFYNPWTVALVAALVGLAGNSYVQSRNAKLQRQLELEKYTSNREIEEYRSEAARILEMIKTQDPSKARINLKFLVSSGLIVTPKLKASLNEFLEGAKAEEVPSLPSSSQRLSISDTRPPILVKSSKKIAIGCNFMSGASPDKLASAFKSQFIGRAGVEITSSVLDRRTSSAYVGREDSGKEKESGVSISWVMQTAAVSNTYEFEVNLDINQIGRSINIKLEAPDPSSSFQGLDAMFLSIGSVSENLLQNVDATLKGINIDSPSCAII